MNRKILIICNSATGLNEFRGMLIDELEELGYQVYAIVPSTKMEVELNAEKCLNDRGCQTLNVEIDRRGLNPINDAKLYLAYRTIIKDIHPTLVITYTIKANVYGGVACRRLHVPYASNITGLGTAFESKGFLRKIAVVLNKIACKKAKVVFFENEENRRFFVDMKIVKEVQTHRLNGAGVDVDKYIITEYSKSQKTKFLFIGRVMAEKGIDELFKAMELLIKDKVDCELDILGEYEEDYVEKIEMYEKKGWLHYYGYQNDVRPFIKNCHCFVLPSWHEGMANTNLECAASGKPIITSDIPGCREAVEDGVTGYLTKKQDVNSLYEVMKEFVQLPYEKRKAMGLAGRKRMEKYFDKRKVVKETIKYLLK